MNVLNLDARNAMDTRRMEHANAYGARTNGLIKSASTSTCCAYENAVFSQPLRRYLVREENVDFGETPDELELLSVQSLVSSLSLSGIATLARNASSRAVSDGENAARKTLKFKFRLNHLKHFSDCNLNSIGLPNHQPHRVHYAAEFNNTHRAVDNVLIGWTGNDSRGSIINFTAMNDIKSDTLGMSTTSSPIEKVEEESGGSDKESIENEEEETKNMQRCRKSSIFETQPLQIVNDEKEEVPIVEDHKENEPQASIVEDNKENEPPVEEARQEKRCRRSSSLKMPKENDTNPAQKKIVRFADALGLDLADVRTFLDELPSVPKSAFSDLKNDEPFGERGQHSFAAAPTLPEKTLVPMFKQPHTSFNFLDRVRDNVVSLEYAKVCPTPVCSISGTVRVRNLDFCKSVYVRYSIDNWLTFNEIQAVYVPDSCDGFSDKFAFVVYVYDVKVNQRVEMAIRYHCSGSIFWDNNNGSNYVFQCLPSAPMMPSYFQSYNLMSDFCNSFY